MQPQRWIRHTWWCYSGTLEVEAGESEVSDGLELQENLSQNKLPGHCFMSYHNTLFLCDQSGSKLLTYAHVHSSNRHLAR